MRRRPSLPTLLSVLFAAVGGCTTTSWSSRITPTMAPSAAAARASPVPVTRALASGPPLPGESIEGWSGLDDAPAGGESPGDRTTRVLDVDAAVELALDQDRELRARLADLGIARGRVRQAGLAPNPEVEIELLPERETRLELAVEYDLSSLVLAPIRAGVARAELEIERIELAGYVVALGYEVRRAYFALAAAESRLAIAQRTLDTMAAERDAAESLHAAGNVTDLDLAARTSAYESSRIEVATLELALSDAREALVRRVGAYGPEAEFVIVTELAPVPGSRIQPDAEHLERRAIEASLELAAMRARLDAIARRGRLERVAGRLPDVSVDVHVLHGRPESRAGAPQDPALRFGAGLTVGVPLFDRRQGVRQAIDAELDATVARYDGAGVAIRSYARALGNRLASAHARVRRFEETIRPLQDRVLDQTRLQYDAMQIDVFRLLAAHRARQAIELAYVDTLRELATAQAAVDALLAGMRVDEIATAGAARTLDRLDSEGEHG